MVPPGRSGTPTGRRSARAVVSRSLSQRLASIFSAVRSKRDYGRNAATDLACTGLGFASGILVARGLGPAGRGQLAAAMMWPGLAAVLFSFGLQHAFAYASGAGWCSAESLHRLAVRYSVLVGVPVALLFVLACPYLYRESFPNALWIPAAFACSIPFTFYSGFLMPIYQGRGAFARWNWAKILRSGAWTAAIGLLVALGAATVFRALVAQIVVMVILGAYLALGLKALGSARDDQPAPLRRLLGYGFAVYASGLAYMVNQQLDQLCLSLYVAPDQLGQYAAAVTVSGMLLFVPGVVGPIVFSRMAISAREEAGSGAHRAEALLVGTALLVPSGVVLAVLGPWVVRILYGAAFAEAGRLLWVLGPAAVFLGLGNILADILRGSGKPMLATYGILVGAVATIGGLAYALPRYGIWGAAWVSLVAYVIMAIGQGVLAWKARGPSRVETPVAV